MYSLIAVASYIIRLFLVPNPFGAMQDGCIWNSIAGAIIGGFSFRVTGLLDLDTSAERSCCYLIQYAILATILCITHQVFWVLGAGTLIIYVAIIVVLFRNRW